MEEIKLFVTCPQCGRRLCKARPGSGLDTQCPKCSKMIQIEVDHKGRVCTLVVTEQPA